MGGGWFPKLVWPKQNMINQQVKVGVANNDKRAKCWCGTGKVGVATATPAIRHSPPMVVYVNFQHTKATKHAQSPPSPPYKLNLNQQSGIWLSIMII